MILNWEENAVLTKQALGHDCLYPVTSSDTLRKVFVDYYLEFSDNWIQIKSWVSSLPSPWI